MKEIIAAIILFVLSMGMIYISLKSFQEKGFLFNNSYIYASREERKKMDKKPYYRQTAIVFGLLGLSFLLLGLNCLLDMAWLDWLEGIIMAGTAVYAVVSSIKLDTRKK